jgi:hypothetical protein
MRTRLLLTAFLITAASAPPAMAQQSQESGGIPTETQRRMARGDAEFPWDLLGLFGLIGLLGLARKHPDDSYHPSSME